MAAARLTRSYAAPPSAPAVPYEQLKAQLVAAHGVRLSDVQAMDAPTQFVILLDDTALLRSLLRDSAWYATEAFSAVASLTLRRVDASTFHGQFRNACLDRTYDAFPLHVLEGNKWVVRSEAASVLDGLLVGWNGPLLRVDDIPDDAVVCME